MSTTLGNDRSAAPAPGAGPVPPATRAHGPGWRDPRMWIGIVLVAASVVLGARLFAEADDSVQVWAAAGPMAAGQPVTGEDLVPTRVRFTEPGDLDRYLLVDDPLPADATLGRSVGAGELVPAASLGGGRSAGVTRVPLAVPTLRLTPALEPGDRVSVYVTSETNEVGVFAAEPVFTDVEVVHVDEPGDSFGGATSELRIVVGLDERQQRGLTGALSRIGDGTVTVVGRD